MVRSTHLWRRGGVYWWRRRFTGPDGVKIVVAVSLGVRVPAEAEFLCRRVDVEIDRMIQEAAFPTGAEMGQAIKRFVLLYRVDMETRLYEDFERAKKLSPEERRSFLWSREYHARVAEGICLVAVAFGPVRSYSDRVDRFLTERGFEPHIRDKVAHRIENGAVAEVYSYRSLIAGTPREQSISDELDAIGYEPHEQNRVEALKNLAATKALLEKRQAELVRTAMDDPEAAQAQLGARRLVARHYDDEVGMAPPFASADAMERGDFEVRLAAHAPVEAPAAETPSVEQTPAPAIRSAESLAEAASVLRAALTARDPISLPPDHEHPEAPTPPEVLRSDDQQPASVRTARPTPFRREAPPVRLGPLEKRTGISEVVDTLIAENTKLPRRDRNGKQPKAKWDEKTGRQVRGVGQLFAAVVGSDALSEILPAHITTYGRVLDHLPTSFGKSSTQRKLSLEAILEEAEELPDELKGRSPGTKNRHATQLAHIIEAIVAEGYAIPGYRERLAGLRETNHDREAPCFTCEEVTRLAATVENVESPSLYWITLIGIYTGARRSELAGLRVAEIDFEKKVIILVPNAYRKLKTPKSARRLPLHPELIRLGFLEYARKICEAGHDLLFPDLRERGEVTSLGDLFSKQFDRMMKVEMAEVSAAGKTFHSLRHYVNSQFLAARPPIPDATRYKLMGHKSEGNNVNIDVYSHFDDETLREAIATLPAVTANLRPRS